MKLAVDNTKEYGLVLEGGGAKGAYQIGVWKALLEAGIRIKGIAGTSVGGLNGAFIAMGDWEKARDVWENLTYSKIMDVDDDVMDRFLKGKSPLGELWDTTVSFIRNKGYDVTPLKHLIADNVDCDRIRSYPGDVIVMSLNLDTKKEEEISLKDKTDSEIHDFLLATAYMAPVFRKTATVDGARYVDGGMGDNVPVDVLISKNYKDLIVIRIYGIGVRRLTPIPENVHITEIAPRHDLGSIMAFTEENSRHNIVYGYYSGMRTLYGLQGETYYLDEEDRGEVIYLRKLLAMIDKKEGAQTQDRPSLRHVLEEVLPDLAKELSLPAGWNYRKLYLAVLEKAAEFLKVNKWNIYTAPGLLEEIRKGLPSADPSAFPDYVKMAAALVKMTGPTEGGIISDTIPDSVKEEMKGDYT